MLLAASLSAFAISAVFTIAYLGGYALEHPATYTTLTDILGWTLVLGGLAALIASAGLSLASRRKPWATVAVTVLLCVF